VATALLAAEHWHRVFLLSTDSAHSVGDALGRTVGAQPVEIAPGVVAQEVAALAELDRSWSEIQAWLHAFLRSDTDELMAEELLVFPGLEELVALRAVRGVEALGEFDVCVVDCAPTGSTLRLLRFPDVLRLFMENFFDIERRAARWVRPIAKRLGAGQLVAPDSVFEAVERLYHEIEDVRQILLDEDRTSARLVVNPARVVVDETRRSFAYLSLYGVATDAVLVNRVLPQEAAGGYFARWAEHERRELDAIASSFPSAAPPLRPHEVRGGAALRALASALRRARPGRPLRLARPFARPRRGATPPRSPPGAGRSSGRRGGSSSCRWDTASGGSASSRAGRAERAAPGRHAPGRVRGVTRPASVSAARAPLAWPEP
jgi:arsenite-transporting ATPase